jgi:hypothetical protein
MNSSCKVQVRLPGAADATPRLTWGGLYKVSGAAALAAGALLLAALVDFIIAGFQSGMTNGWLSLLGDNWLMTLFKLHAGVEGVQMGQLYAFNYLDITIMAIVALMFLGLFAATMKASKFLSLIALVQPFLGIAIFAMTGTAGRSAIMGSVLVISLAMLRNHTFDKAVAYIGLLASVFLLSGDLSVGFTRSGAIAFLVGAGYVLLMTWLFLVSRSLFRRGRGTTTEEVSPH